LLKSWGENPVRRASDTGLSQNFANMRLPAHECDAARHSDGFKVIAHGVNMFLRQLDIGLQRDVGPAVQVIKKTPEASRSLLILILV
jgi:hypothetical protein